MTQPQCLLLLKLRAPVFVGAEHLPGWLARVLSNMALQRTVRRSGPHPFCQPWLACSVRQAATWSAAERRR